MITYNYNRYGSDFPFTPSKYIKTNLEVLLKMLDGEDLKQYKEKSGIWFWDARNPKENAYALEEFHHPEDLALKLTAKNPDEANQDLD